MATLRTVWEIEPFMTAEVRDHLEALYHAEITGLDRALGGFLAELAREERVIVIVVSDHGESLGEHGLRFKHGPHVFPADVRVPLAVRGVKPFEAGLSDALVRTVDIFGTILAALGVEAALPEGAGNLADWARGGAGLPAYSEASMPWAVERAGDWANAHKQRVIRTRQWSLVETPWENREVFYERARDWDELGAGATPPADTVASLQQRLTAWTARGRYRPAPNTVDPEAIRRLEALGYIE
jgi:arylsulfatase A-like enzyme